MPLESGTSVGPYKLISQLGSGGMGEVYLALDTRLGRNVALKFLSSDFTTNDERVRRFQQEARAASKLNHPNLITIFDVGEVESTHFIATEYIEGETLRDRMYRGRMPISEICDIAIQVASALVIAHAAGIMHRDIKPENIMIRPDKLVKVLDFGLAKLSENAARSGDSFIDPAAPTRQVHTEFGMVMGTINYMSPEQARGVKVDARTDIFSLGVVIYEMISGRVPFEGQTYSDVIAAIISKRPSTLTRYYPEIPAELERIVNKSLAKDRDERYQTIKDMLIDLKKLKQQVDQQPDEEDATPFDSASRKSGSGSGGQAPAPLRTSTVQTKEIASARSTSSAEYIVNSLRRHKRGAVVVMAGLVVAAVGVLYFATRPGPTSLAVIPFYSLSEEPMMKRVSDDMTQRIITGLSRLPNLKMISYTAVSQLSLQGLDAQRVGRDLDVSALLIGKIDKRENDIALDLELVNTRDNTVIWRDQYERKFADIRAVQEEILRNVSAKLDLKFSEEEQKRRQAERLYEEGRNLWEKRTAEALRKARDSFEQAIQIKPDFALPYAGVADCYNMLGSYGAERPIEAFPKAKESARRAIELDPTKAEGYTSLAFAAFRGDWNWAEAEKNFVKAIEKNGNYGQAHQWYANYLAAVGRHTDAESATKRAQNLEPSSLVIQSHFGFIYYFAHRYDDVIATSQKVLSLDPTFFIARRYLGWAYMQKGNHREAINQFRQAVQASGNSPLMRAELSHALAASGDAQNRAEAERLVDELVRLSTERYISGYHLAVVYAGLGKNDEAFNWLERAMQERADFLVYLNVDPRWDPIRSDSRFQSLLERMKFP